MTDPTPDPLREALTFLRRRLVGTPPDVDAGDVWMASLLDEAEAIGRAALRSTPAAPQPDAGLREALGTASDTIDRMGWELDRLRQPDAGTTTDCPLVGVHEHAFRGPHRFHEWEPKGEPMQGRGSEFRAALLATSGVTLDPRPAPDTQVSEPATSDTNSPAGVSPRPRCAARGAAG